MPLIYLCIALLFVVVSAAVSAADHPAIRFDRLSVAQGLSQGTVLDIEQDHQGFIWIATYDGLNRFDGYSFKQYRHSPDKPGSLSGSSISALFIDSQGRLWVGNDETGLNLFNREHESFSYFKHDPQNPNSLSNNFISAISEDGNGRIWVATRNHGVNLYDENQQNFIRFTHHSGDEHSISSNKVNEMIADGQGRIWLTTQGGGLNRYDAGLGGFVNYRHNPEDPRSISHDSLYGMYFDSSGRLWLGSENGLNQFDVSSAQVTRYFNEPGDSESLINNLVWSITEDDSGHIWVGTDGGIAKLDVNTGKFLRLVHHPQDPQSLGHNAILSSFKDKDNNLWFGTAGSGVNMLDLNKARFGHYKHVGQDTLSNNMVIGFHQDEQGNIWIGTDGGGLNRIDAETGAFSHFLAESEKTGGIHSNRIWSIKAAPDNRLWLGSFGDGVSLFDPTSGHSKKYSAEPQDPTTIAGNWVYSLYVDRQGQFWACTGDGGLNRYDATQDRFYRYLHDPENPHSLASNLVTYMLQDQQNRYWVATDNGLHQFDGKNNHFKRYIRDDDNSGSLNSSFILSIFEDSRHNIWIGTVGGGLSRYNEDSDSFTNYGIKQGLPNEIVYGILEDNSGKLWISTNHGLAKFDPVNKTFRNYDMTDGLQSNEFNSGSFYKTADGRLLFGGINGFNYFWPGQIKDQAQSPTVVLTDFMLFNRTVSIGNESNKDFYLPRAVNELTQLNLSYRQSLITFEFAALSYKSPLKTQYQYQLQGFDEQWLDADARFRRATYTNLPPGEFTLKVRATNADGQWSEKETELKLKVTPAPWRSVWAYFAYLLLLIGAIYAFIQNRIHHNKVRNELQLVSRLKQLDKMKDSFLANTSHELRTPLNGIIGLAESLLDGNAGKLPAKANQDLALVVTSGRRLANLVNDILDLSKLKTHGIELQLAPVNLQHLVDVVLSLSKPQAQSKGLELHKEIAQDIPAVIADEDRLLQILHNLVGNAVKFTARGSVTLIARVNYDKVDISVCDTGIGIEDSQIARIFESFEQAQSSDDRNYGGTGLGLAISKQLIELHNSEIWVESKPGKGACFNFSLAISDQPAQHKADLAQSIVLGEVEAVDETQIVVEQTLDGRKFKILVVDDEPINRQVLKNHLLSHQYQVFEADNGLSAIAMIDSEIRFDMVLLDVMMPGMSGFEVCKVIRQSYNVSELPVLFLTAKNQVQDIVEGLSVGANDHIAKPIGKQELLSRVSTHLQLLDIKRNLEQIVQERTEQVVQTQHRLELSEKLAALGTLMAGVAHEINNPTHFVHVSVQNLAADLAKFKEFIMALAGDDTDEEILQTFEQQFEVLETHIETIEDGTDRITDIVKDLKSATHLEESEKQVVAVCDILTSTMNLFATKYKHDIALTENFIHRPEIACYPSKLNQVFMNLLVNACDAIMQQPGENKQGKIEVSCEVAGENVIISVSDNGPGMDEQTRQHLFEPFYTTKDIDHGTGLGLSISYDIVQKHHGEILVQSAPGNGTRFSVVLPYRRVNSD